jgi:hypothetical protein
MIPAALQRIDRLGRSTRYEELPSVLVRTADAGPVARAAGQSLTAALATGNGPCAGPLSSGR